MRVLLFESDPALESELVRALGAAGHRCLVRRDPTAAAEILRADGPFDAVVAGAAEASGAAAAMRDAAAPLVVVARRGDVAPVDVLALPISSSILADADGVVPALEVERFEDAVRTHADRARARRLVDAFASAEAGSVLVDAHGAAERANEAFARWVGADRASLVGTPLAALLAPAPGEDAAALSAALEGGPAWSGEVHVLRGDGTHVTGLAHVAPAGRGQGCVVSVLDLTRRVEAEASLRAANRRLEERSRLDPLCGLFNRAYFHEVLDRELARARRYHHPFAVLMVDLDDFKRINDAWGHDAGDEVLRAVSSVLRGGFREGDVVARYGGDEFCALLPSTDEESALAVAQRVCERVREQRLGPRGTVGVHASLGLATVADVDVHASGAALLRLADRAMLAAKRVGGNRVVSHREALELATHPAPTPAPRTSRRPAVLEPLPPPPADATRMSIADAMASAEPDADDDAPDRGTPRRR